MSDTIFERFLKNMQAEARELQKNSDNVLIVPDAGNPPFRYLVTFKEMSFLISNEQGVRLITAPLSVVINFPEDYLHSLDSNLYLKIVNLLRPDFFHPNAKFPVVCLGHEFLMTSPGLTEIISHLYNILTYRNMNVSEADAMNFDACVYLREHTDIIKKISVIPLRRKKLNVSVKVVDLKS
ncbi:hypothetical protein JXQ31_02715 [candidate division KSB1 bacterium]|nr:hypothetical protein [candidate division KSB1 bacterium]